MLKKFKVKNYKNFKDEICVDFGNIAGYQFSTDCIADGMIRKMLIYGRNATGKTNLGRAFMDICQIVYGESRYTDNGIFLNADTKEDFASFSYTFQFGNEELTYKYTRFPNQELGNEELVINGIIIFRCDFITETYNFDHLKYINAETANIERYLQPLDMSEAGKSAGAKLPFLRWLVSNMAFQSNSIIIRFDNYVKRMALITVGNARANRIRKREDQFYELLDDRNGLQDFEDFLNEMGIKCNLKLKELPDGHKELYFAHEKLIPFYENASSGTLALVDLYRRLITWAWDASFIYLDEFDAFYHYEMAENVIRFFKKKYPQCQMIMTSHNTNLMTNRLMRPDCVFILSGTGRLTALCNATQRELREGHNLEKMYISGEFEKYE